VSSKHCYQKDILILKYQYTLPEIIKLREYLDIMEATEEAFQKDEEEKAANNTKG